MGIAKISRFVLQHKLPVAIFWVIVTVAGFISVGPATNAFSQEIEMPGSESTEVNDIIAERYGNGSSFSVPLVAVVSLPAGTTVDSPGVQEELGNAFGQVASEAPNARVVSYASTGDRDFVSEDGQTTFGLIYTTGGGMQESPDIPIVKSVLADATIAGAPIKVTGIFELGTDGGDEGGGGVLVETLVGALGALIILLWVYGSFLAFAPLLMAAIAIVTTYLLAWGMTTVTPVSGIVQFFIALIGLGVAIDYSLLVVTRWREERANGLDNQAAVQRAMETAGHSVIFSGTTVAIGLLALVALPVPFLRSMGLVGMLIPLVSVVISITLLPVVLATIGPRLDWPRLRRGSQVSRIWERWAGFAVRRRGIAAVVAIAILVALIVPAFDLNTGFPRAESLGSSGETREALDDLERAGFGPGVLTPYEVLVENGDPAEVATALEQVEGIQGAAAPEGPGWQQEGTALVVAMPQSDDSSPAGGKVVDRARDVAGDLSGRVRIGGFVANNTDFNDAIYGSFPLMLGLVILITFVLLVRAFRSILLPLKAVILNILSVGAAYGIMVLMWQKGYGSEAIWGIESTGAITTWLPIMVFAFLFGLSMDYEVFILSRIREEYDATGSTDQAVIRGMAHTGRLVTTAAMILFLAFVALAAVPDTNAKIMATGLAAGILLDATIVRALLVPATVSLMGRWNWWLPAWLERIVPLTEPDERAHAGQAAARSSTGNGS